MRNVIKLAVFAGLGLYDRVREEVEELVKRGELLRHEGDELLTEAATQETARLKAFQEKAESAVRGAIEKLPMPASSRDVTALEERIRLLEQKLAEIEKAPVPA